MSYRPLLAVGVVALSLTGSDAKTIRIEFLKGNIEPKSAFVLEGLFCRNVDKIVHVNISVDWPEASLSNNSKNVNFWTNRGESDSDFSFPTSKVDYQHGSYLINGYFILRSGGTHQGVNGTIFQPIDDATVMLNPSVKEVPAKWERCK